MGIVTTIYLAIAALVAAFAYYGGVINRPPAKLFMPVHRILLAVTALAVGVLWPLFMPGLAVHAVRQLRRVAAARQPGWLLHVLGARARG